MERDFGPITPYTEFDSATWVAHLRAINPFLCSQLQIDFLNPEATDKHVMMDWLREKDPAAAITMKGCENAWANAAQSAFHGTVFLIKMYDQAKIGVVIDECPTPQNTPVMEHEENVEEERSKPSYRKKGQWDNRFIQGNYALWRSREPIAFLFSDSSWGTYYDVNSEWERDNLLDYFAEEEIEACAIKDLNVSATLEMLRWKVVTQESFTPDSPPAKRIKTAKNEIE